MSTKDRVREDFEKRHWRILRQERELGIRGIRCYVSPNAVAPCELWVGIAPNSDELLVSHDWQQGAVHTASVRGLTHGKLYDRSGEVVQQGVIAHQRPSSCTLSYKPEEGYKNAWEALSAYANFLCGHYHGMSAEPTRSNRPYTFDLPPQDDEAAMWTSHVSQEKVAIIGLGGVGSWIADLVVKSDALEVHGWDYDYIESKNILRMPGAVDPRMWINKPKAEWFKEAYGRVHANVSDHNVKVTSDNVKEVLADTTFAFVAVDLDEDRTMICESLANAGIPFVVAGLSLTREVGQVSFSARIITAYPQSSTWETLLPHVGQAGQEDYGSLDIADAYSIVAGWAVQSWRKMRGQILSRGKQECLGYHAFDQSIALL